MSGRLEQSAAAGARDWLRGAPLAPAPITPPVAAAPPVDDASSSTSEPPHALAPERRHVSVLLMVLSGVLHGALFVAYLSAPAAAQPQAREQQVEIEMEVPPPPPPEAPPVPLPQAARPVTARPRAPSRPREIALPKADPQATPDPDQELVPEEPEVEAPVAAQPGPPGPAVPASAPGPALGKIVEAQEGANYLKNPRPAYPPLALEREWEGTVLLRVRVTPQGHPENVLLARSSGRKILDDAALATVKTWAFMPARAGSTPVHGWVTVPIVFKIQ